MRYSDAGVCRKVSMSELLNREGLSTAMVRDSEFSVPRTIFWIARLVCPQRQRVRLVVISAKTPRTQNGKVMARRSSLSDLAQAPPHHPCQALRKGSGVSWKLAIQNPRFV